MSLEAVIWAQDHAPVEGATDYAVLSALARSADKHGRGAYPSTDTIMWRTRLKRRAVQYALDRLETESKVIRRGDQSMVDHLRPDDRPAVWDLDMTMKRAERTPKDRRHRSKRGAPDAPRTTGGGAHEVRPAEPSGVHEMHERGASDASAGCTSCANGVHHVHPEKIGEKTDKKINQTPDDRNSSEDQKLHTAIEQRLLERTGRPIPPGWAPKVAACIFGTPDGRPPGNIKNPIGYALSAIDREPDPVTRFYPSRHSTPPTTAEPDPAATRPPEPHPEPAGEPTGPPLTPEERHALVEEGRRKVAAILAAKNARPGRRTRTTDPEDKERMREAMEELRRFTAAREAAAHDNPDDTERKEPQP